MWAARVIGMRPWVCARSGIYELKEQLRCLLGRQVQGRHIIQPNLSQYRYNNLPRKHGVDGRIRNERRDVLEVPERHQ